MSTATATPASTMDTTHNGPCLIQLSGAHPSHRLALSRPAILCGGHPACDFRFSGSELADFHCLLVQTPTGYLIRDCKSPVGTLVNGMAIAETQLKNGDHLQLGSLEFRVQLPEEGPGRSGPAVLLERLSRRRARLAQLAWRKRTQVQLQSRRLAEAEQRLAQASTTASSGGNGSADVAKMREELLRRREQLDAFRQELEKREAEMMAMQQHVMDQAARVGRGGSGNRSTPAEQAAARKELERLKMNIARLGQEEAKLLENLSTFRALEAEAKANLASAQAQLQAQQAMLLPPALLERDQVAQIQHYRMQLHAEVERLTQQTEAARKKAVKFQEEVTALEDELNRLRTEREQENEAYAREREIQKEAFNAHRQELQDLGEQKKRFLAERAKQLEELAAKDAEVTKKLAHLAELEEGLKRQREAVVHETESWVEQRESIVGEVSEKEKLAEQARAHLAELKAQEQKLEASIAEWNAHAEKERAQLEKEVAERRAGLEQEMAGIKQKLLAEWLEKKEDVDEALVQFRHQAEQLWEDFLTKLRVEAKEYTDQIPKAPLS